MTDRFLPAPTGAEYSEIRQHEVRKSNMSMIDGNLTANTNTKEGGISVRVFDKGYWGFSSVASMDRAAVERVSRKAFDNAKAMASFGARPALTLPGDSHSGEYGFNGKAPLSQKECVELLQELHGLCQKKYPSLTSSTFILHDENHSKLLTTSTGSEALNSIQRAVLYMVLTGEDKNGQPVELLEPISCKGHVGDLDLEMGRLEAQIDELYQHLQAKREAVAPRGGEQTVVLSPELSGMLAHEAMGHPCEADIVLGGAVTGNLVGQRVASDLVTMIDFAHSYEGEELMIPVYTDDEGTQAKDAVLIEKGILKEFMTSRETAAKLDIPSVGSARAYTFNDEPLVRMRNTAILPGKDKLEDMIGDVEDGYFLMKTGNGQADSTTEFMFGIELAYEIKDGKLGSAITDTTVSGTAIKMLQTVDAVSDDMVWACNGYCGKKQPMVVSTGGPALRAKAHLGGI
jgi:TldD protein